MIKLQKQLTERSNAVTELEGRFLQLQEVRQLERPLQVTGRESVVSLFQAAARRKTNKLEMVHLSGNSSSSGRMLVFCSLCVFPEDSGFFFFHPE